MMRSRAFRLAATLALSLAVAVPSAADEVVKHSGILVDFDQRTDTIVLAEVGPWQRRNGATVITFRRIFLTPQTEFAIAFRAEGPARGLFGEFVEAPLERAGVYIDDHVTVEGRHDGPRMIALKITVTDLPGGAYQKESER
jgi:hypothetical protein